MNIQELAKELGVPDKDVLAKAKAMGIEVPNAKSGLSDDSASALRNVLAHGGGAETKIVKVTPKARNAEKKDEVVRVTKRANIKPPIRQPKNKVQESVRGVESASGLKESATEFPFARKTPITSGTANAAEGTDAATKPTGREPRANPKPAAATQTGRTSASAEGTVPIRIPAAQVVPKRISREELEAEVRAKQPEDGSERTSSADGRDGGADQKAQPARRENPQHRKKKPALKVAWTDMDGDKPSGTDRKPPKDVAEFAPGKDAAIAAPSGTNAAEQLSDTVKPSSESVVRTDRPAIEPSAASAVGESAASVSGTSAEAAPGGEAAAAINAPADMPGKALVSDAEPAAAEDVKPAAPGNAQTSKSTAGRRAESSGTKATGAKAGGARGERKDESKPKRPQAVSKSKDKKPQKGKVGESFADKNKKYGGKVERKRGAAESFRGSGKSPILEENLLEKRSVRSRPRPRPQQKAEPAKVINYDDLAPGTKILNVPITVAGFAEQVEKSNSEVIMALMKLGVMANVNQNLDETTVQLLSEELGIPIFIASDEGEIVEEGLETFEDKEEDLLARPPIITVMGHVDHGKTSLLDAIRKTNVTGGEAGGITQHIGASEVRVNGAKIVFLDTPGHEAFTAMRARGAHVTDIAVLVVAADDGVMPQTIESISHAKAAGVPVIVAINKIDKPGANPDKVKQELADHGILVEDWGGDTICVPVSAKTGEGIVNLLEMILLQSEVLELKANPDRLAIGTVIEARLDKTKGAVATLLVLNGTIEAGMSIVAGITSGRIRAMTDYKGKTIKKAGPARAVEVIGLNEVPQAGDEFNAVREDRIARDIAESRRVRQREEIMARTSGASLETLFSRISANEIKELNIIIKGDVQGSVGALTASLEKLSNGQVKVRIIHTGVGAVTESDVMLANTAHAVIIGFNVRPGSAVTSLADRENVEIRTYRVIYDAIADVDAALKGMLDPEFREVVLGKVEIRELFKVPGAGVIGGSYVLEGKVQRNADVRVVRDGIVVHEGKISSLRRFKDDVREVAAGYECGIGIENYNDIKEGDIIEAFVMEEIER
ncbi:MAG: translation initiation factor IF-2 [Clostridiales Family XIII bacterium]|jgi:translation initiation factor IF-2|nr:translation initiation factor IF-2 [Clostridiales Family XIII bacterium]